jgi:2-dehydropantoate 2-reductase
MALPSDVTGPAPAHDRMHDPPRARIAVVGLGSIGGVAAACLAAAGRHDIVACMRQPQPAPAMRLTLDRPEGTVDVSLPNLTDPAQAEAADWVLICTKTQQTHSVAPWLSRLCTPQTRVAVLQNGIDHVTRVAPLVNGAAVLPVIVYYNGERLGPDHVRMRRASPNDLVVADGELGRAFVKLLEGTGLQVLIEQDFVTLLWRKLLINAVANPITALTLQRQAVLRRPDIQDLCHAVLAEAVAVARAEGARVADDEAARTIAALMTFSGALGTSMYFDRLAERQIEVEALTGALVAAGERHGIAMPINRALLALLRAVNDAAKA